MNDAFDPKAGEKTYYAQLGPDGMRHARGKPFSDIECGKMLVNLGSMLQMIEPPPASIIDFGCGTGWTSRFLARTGYRVTGVDISEDAIGAARELAAEEKVAGLEFRLEDYETFAAEGEYDYALFYDSLHHAEDERLALAAAYRALKPGGQLFAYEPGIGHHEAEASQHAIARFGVHEKDMPPKRVWEVGRSVGFSRRLILPVPFEVSLYQAGYWRNMAPRAVLTRKLWALWHTMQRMRSAPENGLIILWK